MSHWLFRHFSFGCQKKESFKKAFTLVELLITIAIMGTLAAIAVPTYTDYIQKNNNSTAIVDIRDKESQIERFRAEKGRPPNDLAEAGILNWKDPWGRSYQYVRILGLSQAERDAKCRWDKLDKPLNYDYDLYSMGKDGVTKAKITDQDSHDDIIRASDGAYVGLASKY